MSCIRAHGNSLTLVVLAMVAFAGLGCGGEKPPAQLPSTAARDRAATRVELVELVISDPERAAKVRALYIQMDSLLLDTKRAQARQLALLGAEPPSSDHETRARLAAVQQAESNALEGYVRLQLELRRFTTASEFARLDAVR
ncbi:MAG TPA: hypothetical protein VJV79_20995 [Polyangiaceae bacterium]|nr:hypothetical protein [Polyangiaceae bacterium]